MMEVRARVMTCRFDDFLLDLHARTLFRLTDSGKPTPVSLGSRAFGILCVLIERRGEFVSKHEIMQAVWPESAVEDSNLTVQMSALRRVLDAGRGGESCIRTIANRGYCFLPQVDRCVGHDGATPGNNLDSQAVDPAAIPPLPDEAATDGPLSDEVVSPRPWRRFSVRTVARSVLAIVACAALAWYTHHHSAGLAERPRLSIVVLPFANLNNDPEQAYFADAITDDLTTDLSRIAGSVVIAHITAQTYRDRTVDVKQVGRELDVRYVLEGGVRRMDDRVEVNAQLLDTESGAHVWADRFETDRRAIAEAQREIVGRLARTLNLELLAAADRSIEREKNQDPRAADLIMRGWAIWFQPFSVERNMAAERAFERALQIDPSSIDARIGIATIGVVNSGAVMNHDPDQERARAERLLGQVTEWDPHNSRAHEVLGMLRRIQNRLEESAIEYQTAIALDQNNANAFLGLGQTLTYLGRPAEGIPLIERAIRLHPRDPNSAFDDWALGVCHLLLGDVDRAVDLLRKASSENPRIFFFRLYLAGALGLRGDIAEARTILAEAMRLKPEVNSLASWTAAQPWLGNPALMALRGTTLDAGLHRAGLPDQ